MSLITSTNGSINHKEMDGTCPCIHCMKRKPNIFTQKHLPKYNLQLNVSKNVAYIIHYEAEINMVQRVENENSISVLVFGLIESGTNNMVCFRHYIYQ